MCYSSDPCRYNVKPSWSPYWITETERAARISLVTARSLICGYLALILGFSLTQRAGESKASSMHQHPRPSPKSASPANSPRTNTVRTNNPREPDSAASRTNSERGISSEQGFNMGEGSDAIMRGQENIGQDKEQLAKLSQVVQVHHDTAMPRIGRQT